MDIINTLFSLAATKFNTTKAAWLPDQDIFATLQINSLQAVDLLTDIENEFDIEIPDYELKNVKTFRDLANVIQLRL